MTITIPIPEWPSWAWHGLAVLGYIIVGVIMSGLALRSYTRGNTVLSKRDEENAVTFSIFSFFFWWVVLFFIVIYALVICPVCWIGRWPPAVAEQPQNPPGGK
jgi:hypothetical protein